MSNYGTMADLPLAPGTASNCYTYYNHYDPTSRPAFIDPPQQHHWSASPKTCGIIAGIINVDVEELVKLNPSLERGSCVLEPGFSYCVEETRKSRTSSSPSGSPSPEPPICHFDPEKGEYVCPDQPICRFDPQKGEYVCPTHSPNGEAGQSEGGEHQELRRRGTEK